MTTEAKQKCEAALKNLLQSSGFRVSDLTHGPRYHGDEEQMLEFGRRARTLPDCLRGNSPLCDQPFQGHETSLGSYCRNANEIGEMCGHPRACHPANTPKPITQKE